MKNQLIYILLFIGIISSACSDESNLQRSIFVEDPANPNLPKYSELGYNTFGAYYDREAFTSGAIVPVKVIIEDGATIFTLNGDKGYEDMSLALTISDFTPDHYTDLLTLDDTVLDLTDEAYSVVIKTESSEEEIQILNGTFHFKRAQNILVDKELVEIVLSGTFEFQALVNGEPITVSSGRFDVAVGEDNFYLL